MNLIEGKTVTYQKRFQYACTVTGFDYWIGITLQEKGTNKFVLCLMSPQVCLDRKMPLVYNPKEFSRFRSNYPKIYSYIKKCIEQNKTIESFKIQQITRRITGAASIDTCPFV